jgi:hypothetical protein
MYRWHAGDIGSVSLVACSSTNVWLKCTASIIVFGRETKAGPAGHSVGLRGGVSVKGCHVRGLSVESV